MEKKKRYFNKFLSILMACMLILNVPMSALASETEGITTEPAVAAEVSTEAVTENVTEAPVAEVPETEAPVTEAPATEAPVTEAPATEAPVTEAPATEAPVTEAPATEAPVTEAPATEAPVTEAPVTEAPATEAPVTESEKSEAPTLANTEDEVVEVTGITLDQTEAKVVIGEDSLTLTAEVTPEDATDKTVTWTSSDTAIAAVDEKGVVTAVAAGEATITAAAGGFSATCKVTVIKLADPAEITVTIANQGTLVMIREKVTVQDYDKDGSLDVDDALYAAHNHEKGYNGGAAEGYLSYVHEQYGLSCGKLWGDTSGSFGYVVNDKPSNGLADEVKAGDELTAYIYEDQISCSDAYARFGAEEYTTTAGTALAVTVEEGSRDSSYTTYSFTAVEDAVLTAYDSDKKALSTEKYTVEGYNVTFKEAGTYYLAAAGTENNILVPAVVKVTVEENTGVKVTDITLDAKVLTLQEGSTRTLTAVTEPEEAADAVITWATSDETVATVADGVVTAVAPGSATVTASVGEVSAECTVKVVAKYTFSKLELYKSSSAYNDGEKPLIITPTFDENTYTGYSVEAPDYLSSLYAVVTLSEETLNKGFNGWLYFSNSWGGWSGITASNGVAKGAANFSKGYVSIYADTWTSGEYQVNVSKYATLSNLVIDGVVDAAFNRDLNSYHAYVDGTADGVSITPTAYKSNYAVTVNDVAVTSGEAYTLPYEWDEDGKMEVAIKVSLDGVISSTYTVELEKKPLNDAPFIMTQPVEADYIVGETTKALSVISSANGNMTYQWYSNTTDSNEGGTVIEGATEASYTPSSETVGTVYYYCTVTNTDKTENNITTSNPARVTVDPDPTPVALISTSGEAMPEDGYEYAWDTGYLYKVGDEAIPLTVTATSAAEGGTWSYEWKEILGNPYNNYGWGSVSGDSTSASYTPSTALSSASSNGKYYGCQVTYKFKGKTYTSWATTGKTYTVGEGEEAETYDVKGVYVFIKVDSAAVPEITKQPVSANYIVGDKATALSISAKKADGGSLTYQWYENDTNSTKGGTAIEGATSAYRFDIGTMDEEGTKYYYCLVTNTIQGYTAETASDVVVITVKSAESLIGDKLIGSGTAEEPYQIVDVQDYQDVADLVAQGISFEGMYFKQMNDITLPEGWKPIGVTKNGSNNIQSGANLNAFSGILDGNGKTVTVPAGGLPLLGYVKGAEVRNLNIYGTQIAGYGLVNNFEGVGLSGSAIVIENVTLKSGSSTLKSGLIGANITTNGFAGVSAGFTATIRNCTIESGVVIGYKKDQSMIGSIAGRMQGTIENCVSYATVYGKNYVGGIIGTRDNAMGTCTVSGSEFHGTVSASGEHAGGIVGGGYSGSSAPNGVKISVNNCSVSGSISGADKVGGILGGDSFVAQLWGGYTFKNNSFTGTVSASAGTYVGGIIGFLDSLNKFDDIAANYYASSCGAGRGIGFVQYVDTSCETHETESGATYFNTGDGTDECPEVAGCSWKANHNRTDDPLGADAGKLATSSQNTEPVVISLTVSGNYRTEYYMGEAFDLEGMVFTAEWSDGSVTNPAAEEVTVSDFDTTKRGSQEVTISYKDASGTVTVKVLKGAKVTFSLLGDQKHESDVDGLVHTLADGNLEEWVPETIYYVDMNATIYEVIEKAAEEYGFVISAKGTQYGIYIEAITMNGLTLAELDNGPDSGWMYTVNGTHPDVGVAAKYVEDGDVIVFHYTDNYTLEESKAYDKAEAVNVENTICALPAVSDLTLSDKAAVEAARAAYDALTDDQKTLVSVETLTQLREAEARIAELEEPAQHVHIWDAGTMTKEATCKETGIRTYQCTCGETKTEIIAKSATHKYGSWGTISKATVSAAEVQKRTCSICGTSETQTVGEKLTPVLEVPGKLKSLKLKKGSKHTISITMANGDKLSSVKSKNSKIVKVSSSKKKGTITLKAVKTGSTKITIKLTSGKTRTYTVKVVKGTVKTSKVSLTSKTLTLAKGRYKTLKPILTPFSSTQKITYTSSNKKVATVTSKGKVKAVAPGTAKITIKSGSQKATVKVTVPGVANVKSSLTIKKGKTATLSPKLVKITGDITYTSSNKKVATVSSKGKIKAVKAGTATITVKAGKYKATCKVTVK